jgi:hypothetical protein
MKDLKKMAAMKLKDALDFDPSDVDNIVISIHLSNFKKKNEKKVKETQEMKEDDDEMEEDGSEEKEDEEFDY